MTDQLGIFSNDEPMGNKPTEIGSTNIVYKNTSQILTRTSGFMADYDFSLNPYSGWSFNNNYLHPDGLKTDNTYRFQFINKESPRKPVLLEAYLIGTLCSRYIRTREGKK